MQSPVMDNDLLQIEGRLRDELVLDPDNAVLLEMLSKVLINLGRFAESESLLSRAFALSGSVSCLEKLASVQYALKAFDRCKATLEKLITQNPKAERVYYLTLAKVLILHGRRGDALRILSQANAIHADDAALFSIYMSMLAEDDPQAACHDTEAALKNPDLSAHDRSLLLATLTAIRLPAIRHARNLPIEAAVSWHDVYQWTDEEGLEDLHAALSKEITLPSTRLQAFLDLAFCAVSKGRWELAEQILQHVRASGIKSIANTMSFDMEFLASVTSDIDRKIREELPAVQHIMRHERSGGAVLFLPSDPVYFELFTVKFLQRLQQMSLNVDVQIHLLDGTREQWTKAATTLSSFQNLSIGLSAEASGASERGVAQARLYYHAIRFIRFYQELVQSDAPIWQLDVDVNVLGDLTPLLNMLSTRDLALRGIVTAIDFRGRLMGCCVGVAPTEKGRDYARLIAALIARWRRTEQWEWGVDQLSLFCAAAYLTRLNRAPDTVFLQPTEVCFSGQTTGVLQFPGGISKYEALQLAVPPQ